MIEQLLAAAMAAEEKSALAEQLQYALDYRVVIERAIGYLMGKHDLTATQAFTGLRKQARDSRRRVADLAAELLGEGAGEMR
ncbi:ANTAR domain-containing protein [Streptosporangium sp. CA-115845]|uniref:ANTAR domain-containing protein n=1 Tax=Streptosporangium sp. CA-115845 TaxID=3240071 RepID=UPI003D921486